MNIYSNNFGSDEAGSRSRHNLLFLVSELHKFVYPTTHDTTQALNRRHTRMVVRFGDLACRFQFFFTNKFGSDKAGSRSRHNLLFLLSELCQFAYPTTHDTTIAPQALNRRHTRMVVCFGDLARRFQFFFTIPQGAVAGVRL